MISVNGVSIDFTSFPDNTTSFRYNPCCFEYNILWRYDDDRECILLWYLVNHIRENSEVAPEIVLTMPYIPNARMDRVKAKDEVFTLKWFSDFINLMYFDKVVVHDPHSNVSTALINHVVSVGAENETAICYTIFDVIPALEFEQGESKDTYRQRREALDAVQSMLRKNSPVSILPVLYSGTDQSMIGTLLDKMVEEDKEGLMVNLDTPYYRKRHSGILKVKRFYTMDLPIIACEEGAGRLAGILGAFVLQYKENEVRVGTGFTNEQRISFWDAAQKSVDLSLLVVVMMIGVRIKISFAVSVGRRLTGAT